jgi:hypothetical protein
MQGNATAHTANNSMNALAKFFDEWLLSQGLWPAHSPNLNPCNFYLWSTLKDRVYENNSHSLQEMKENILLFQENNFTVYLEIFFEDVRHAQKKVDTSRRYSLISQGENG